MKDGIAVFGVAGSCNLAELLRDGIPFAQHQAGEHGLMELLIKREMTGEEAAVERGQREFQVIGIEAAGFLHGARSGAGAKPDVPHALDDGANSFPGLLFSLFVRESEQDVDVGVGKEILAPVSAQGEQRNAERGQAGEGPSPHFNEDTVYHGGAAVNGGGSIPGALTGLANEHHLPRILLPKIVNRQSDWIHEGWCGACRSK